jgi:hypothetical protein
MDYVFESLHPKADIRNLLIDNQPMLEAKQAESLAQILNLATNAGIKVTGISITASNMSINLSNTAATPYWTTSSVSVATSTNINVSSLNGTAISSSNALPVSLAGSNSMTLVGSMPVYLATNGPASPLQVQAKAGTNAVTQSGAWALAEGTNSIYSASLSNLLATVIANQTALSNQLYLGILVGATNASQTAVGVSNLNTAPLFTQQVGPGTNAVGGFVWTTAFAPAIATGAYGSNDCLGTVQTLTNACRTTGGSATIMSVTVYDYTAQNAPLEILVFNKLPTGTYTDDAVPAPASTDGLLTRGPISILASDYKKINSTNAVAYAFPIHLTLKNNESSQNLYYQIICNGTPTYAATNRVVIGWGLIQD